MSDPFEDRVRAAFKKAALPAAPDTLHRQVAAVTAPAPARTTAPRTGRWLLLPAAAILAIVAGFALFVIGSRPSVVPVATSSPSPSLVPTPTPGPSSTPTPSATATPAGSPAFVTATPPAPGTAWTSLTWQPLAAGDPLRLVQQVVRWQNGFLAIGAAVATADGSRTPVWTSVDGAQWFALPESTFGVNGVVVAAGGVGNRLVALTVTGGPDACPADLERCWTTAPPLTAWKSTDGTTWTAHDAPLPIALQEGEQTVGPIHFASNGTTAVVEADGLIATTQDGISWSQQPQALAATDQIDSAATVGGGFLLAGASGCPNCQGLVLWSADGSAWQEQSVFTGQSGIIGGRVVAAGGSGVMVAGVSDLVPGPTLWWASPDGRTWQRNTDLAPLGVWNGEGAGSGLLPNGELVGDGERMIAYDTVTGGRSWTSFNGSDWTSVAVSGSEPPAAGSPGNNLRMLPIGLIWDDGQGGTWIGVP